MPRAVDGWKVCSKCGERKTISAFYQHPSAADGLGSWCKECMSVHGKASYATNREARLARQRAYDTTEKGTEVRLRAQRRYYQTEKGRAAHERYSQTEKGRVAIARGNAKRRALKVDVVSNMPSEDLVLLITRQFACNYCGYVFIPEHPLHRRTVDHIVPLSRGGQDTLDNVVLACQRCNSQKGDKLPEEWVDRWYEQEEEELRRGEQP